MNEIATKLKIDTLICINELMPYYNSGVVVAGARIGKSILAVLATKLLKKQLSRQGKNPAKELTVSLYYHEAVTLEKFLRNAAEQFLRSDSFEYHRIITFCNQLNQQTA